MSKMAAKIDSDEVIDDQLVEDEESELGQEAEEESKEKNSEEELGGEEEIGEDPEDKTRVVDEDEVVVTIGEEAPPPDEIEHAPEWVKELRKTHRETTKENRELKQKLKHLEEGGSTKPQSLGAKPKLEDHDYDTEAFEKALEKWHDQKRRIEQEQAKVLTEQKNQEETWKQQLNQYNEQKSQLKVKDFDDVEADALEQLSVTQQGVIVQGAENSALVIYALGKNPKKMQELSSITDPVKFAFAVAKLEAQLKVTNRKAPPPPEKKVVTGTGSKAGVVDSTLDRLRAKAEKTGDYTEVSQYKKQKRQTK